MYGLTVLLLSTASAFLHGSDEFISFSNIEQRKIPGKGFGLVTLEERKADEPLFTIDKTAIFYVKRDFPLRKNIEKVFKNYAKTRNKLGFSFLNALGIMFYTYPDKKYIEQQIDALKLDRDVYYPLSSLHSQYFESNPKDCSSFFTFERKTQDLLLFLFGEVEMREHFPIFEELMQLLRNRLKNLPKKKREFLSKVLDNEEKLKIILCWLSSRNFWIPEELREDSNKFLKRADSDEKGGMMIPVVDLINSCFSKENQPFKFEVEEEKAIFSISKDFKQGEELCFTYSIKKNLNYFLGYGFFDPRSGLNSFERVVDFLSTEENRKLASKFDYLHDENKVHLNFEINKYQEVMTLYALFTGKLAFELIVDVVAHSRIELEGMELLVYSLQETLNYLKKHSMDENLVQERLNAVRVKLSQHRVHFYYLINAADDLIGKLDSEIQSML